MMAPNSAELLLRSFNELIIMAAVNELTAIQKKPTCQGGILAVAIVNRKTKESHFASRSIGRPGEKFGGRAKNAAEKIARLYERRMAGMDEFASSQSADPENENVLLRTYGGSDVLRDPFHPDIEVYFSFSGAPADVDEVICFVLGEKAGYVPYDYRNDLLSDARRMLAEVRS